MAKVHSKIPEIKDFVCVASGNYREALTDPNWKGGERGAVHDSEEFMYILERDEESKSGKKKKKKRVPYRVPWEAHHILSVSCVNNLDKLTKGQKESVIRCCKATTWNINDEENLIALPLFGHTIKWYEIDENEDPPQWQDLPQHDWDHNSTKGYCTDVRNDILDFYKSLEAELDEHGLDAKSIRQELIDKQTHWRKQINNRGTKAHSNGKGTHKAWEKQKHDWYKPFSMANDGSEGRRPPLRINNKRDKLAKLLTKWRPS